MSYRIEIGYPGEGNVTRLEANDLAGNPSVKLSHSQMVDWSLDTHYDPGFTTYAETFAPIRLFYQPAVGQEEVLFRGEVVRHSREDGGPGSNALSRIEGHCRQFTQLKRSAPLEIVTYTNISARDAIQNYWRNFTPFDATVHEQPLDNLPPIESVELTDDHLSNLQKLHDRANFVWSVDHSSPDLEVESFARGHEKRPSLWELDEREESEAISVKHDDDRRDYANIVIGLGGSANGGGRLRYDAVNTNEIERLRNAGCPAEKSCAVVVVSDSDAGTLDEVQTMAETELSKRVEERKTKGSISVIPTWVQPGFSYDVEALDEDDLVLDTVEIDIGNPGASGSLNFVDEYGYARDQATLRGQIKRIVDSL